MKFLIQKIDGQIVHDFSFVLLETIRFQNWLQGKNAITKRFYNTMKNQTKFEFKPLHLNYVPVGSVEFVTAYLEYFYGLTPKPLNIPKHLHPFAGGHVIHGNEKTIFKDMVSGREYYIKSNDVIKGYHKSYVLGEEIELPVGNYQAYERFSFDSEWRAFVYENKLVGLQNYAGDFTIIPNRNKLRDIIDHYAIIAPVAYTLDVAISDGEYIPDVIEVHDFFSCGLYGFSDHSKYANMLSKWFWEYIRNNTKKM